MMLHGRIKLLTEPPTASGGTKEGRKMKSIIRLRSVDEAMEQAIRDAADGRISLRRLSAISNAYLTYKLFNPSNKARPDSSDDAKENPVDDI